MSRLKTAIELMLFALALIASVPFAFWIVRDVLRLPCGMCS